MVPKFYFYFVFAGEHQWECQFSCYMNWSCVAVMSLQFVGKENIGIKKKFFKLMGIDEILPVVSLGVDY